MKNANPSPYRKTGVPVRGVAQQGSRPPVDPGASQFSLERLVEDGWQRQAKCSTGCAKRGKVVFAATERNPFPSVAVPSCRDIGRARPNWDTTLSLHCLHLPRLFATMLMRVESNGTLARLVSENQILAVLTPRCQSNRH